MPISQIVDFCKDRYDREERCADCEEQCTGCENCLDNMHFLRTQRRYECDNISDYYVCKYIYKYASEIDHLLDVVNIHELLNDFQEYKLLSVGCGPSTEFFGFLSNMLRHRIEKTIGFMGLDFNNVWESIHQHISNVIVPTLDNVRVRFSYRDGLDYLHNYPLAATPPNVLLLQYVLSDIQGHGGDVAQFINDIAINVVPSMPVGSVIIINDINHYNPRDHFDRLHNLLNATHTAARYHFANNNRFPYQYGHRHENNNILYAIPRDVIGFNPWTFCSSAQMILQKRA